MALMRAYRLYFVRKPSDMPASSIADRMIKAADDDAAKREALRLAALPILRPVLEQANAAVMYFGFQHIETSRWNVSKPEGSMASLGLRGTARR
jgi:hypothetical protein